MQVLLKSYKDKIKISYHLEQNQDQGIYLKKPISSVAKLSLSTKNSKRGYLESSPHKNKLYFYKVDVIGIITPSFRHLFATLLSKQLDEVIQCISDLWKPKLSLQPDEYSQSQNIQMYIYGCALYQQANDTAHQLEISITFLFVDHNKSLALFLYGQ